MNHYDKEFYRVCDAKKAREKAKAYNEEVIRYEKVLKEIAKKNKKK